jgi:hypothetical protein
MEKIGKIFCSLLVFLIGLWIWNTYAVNLTNQVLFIIAFLAAPFIWALEEKKTEVSDNIPRQTTIIGEFLRNNIRFLPYYIIPLLLILKFIFDYFGNTDYANAFELLFFTFIMGMFLHLVIRNTERD